MNVVNKVTWKSLCQNKKRTIVTIMGVIICVAMLTAISVIGSSFQNVMLRSAIETNGNYEISFNQMKMEEADRLIKDAKVKQSMRMAFVGDVNLKDVGYDISGGFRSTMEILAIDPEHPELVAMKLLEGAMPEKENEIVICQQMMNHERFDKQIGDRITLPIVRVIYEQAADDPQKVNEIREDLGEKSYTITGIVSCDNLMASRSGYMAFTNYTNTPYKQQNVNVSLNLQSTENFFEQQLTLGNTYQSELITYNNSYLNYKGVDTMGILSIYGSVILILIIIILIGGISLIYNAFSISLSERGRYLGMLSSVGATRKQKRNSVFFEAFVIGIIAIPIGLLAGVAGIAITFIFLNPYIAGMFDITNVSLKVVIDWRLMLFTIGFSIIILLISAWIPAKRASRITAISAIRQSEDVKIRARDVKTSKLTRKVFGVEAELGLKNMKRNHSRYLSTLSSLIICIILFMSAQYFSIAMKESVSMMQSSTDADIITNFYRTNDAIVSDDEFVNSLRSLPDVTSSIAYSEYPYMNLGTSMKVTEEIKEYIRKQYGMSEQELLDQHINTSPLVKIQVLSDVDFIAYCKQAGIDPAVMQQEQPSTILVNQRTIKDSTEKTTVYRNLKLLDIEEGDAVKIYRSRTEETGRINDPEVAIQIAAMTNHLPSVNQNNTSSPEVYLVMDEKNITKLTASMKKDNLTLPTANYEIQFKTKNPEKLGNEVTEIVIGSQDYAGSVTNISLQKLKNEQRYVFINTLLYGFVTLILLICVANIMNSISTSVNLRKREFAMIKSIGITKRKFNRMICFETLFYGIKACLYGIPLGMLAMSFLFRSFTRGFVFEFVVQWKLYLLMIVGVFFVLSMTMAYAIHKIRKDNIVETIRSESI